MPPGSKRTLLFLHVHRTGGAMLTGILTNRFAARDCLQLYFGPEPDLSDLDRYRYVSGHLDISFLERFEHAPFVITFLRDPVERALSSYAFARSFPDAAVQPAMGIPGRLPTAMGIPGRPPPAERVNSYRQLSREVSIGELIEREPEIAREFLGNRQARVLSGSDPAGGDERLGDALLGLERCDFVGLTARMDESVGWLSRRLGWRDMRPLPRTNLSAESLGRDELSSKAMEALLDLTSVDRELYRAAQILYERRLPDRRWASESRDPSAGIPDAPTVADLRFDEAIAGGGWLSREHLGSGPGFCWIGDTRHAWVEMMHEPGASSLIVEIAHVIAQPALESLRISVDGRGVSHTLAEMPEGVVAKAQLKRRRPWGTGPRRVRVALDIAGSTGSTELDPQTPDPRDLSIAVRRIAFSRD